MNRYLVVINLKGRIVKTVVYAENTLQAKHLAEFQFGSGSLISAPSLLK